MTQKAQILNLLRKNGTVSRNEALQIYISRLGAIILTLKKAGMDIEGKWLEGDYIYTLKDKPKVIEYKVAGIVVSKKTVW